VWALRIKKRLCQRFDTTSFLYLLTLLSELSVRNFVFLITKKRYGISLQQKRIQSYGTPEEI
ncbi:hypothetical protein, partial [Bacteroides caccae]